MKLIAIFEAEFVKFTREENPGDDSSQADPTNSSAEEIDPTQSQDDVPQDGELDGENQGKQGSKEDLDRQGSIRTVPDAHLVYKRKNENNLYDELWIYKQNQHDTWTMRTYDAIISGSDIPKGSSTSPDGTQKVDKWEVGDPKDTLVFVHITGLAN